MKVKLGISMRHVHLTDEDCHTLFGKDLTIKNELSQPGQYAANETVILKNNDRELKNVRVLGPNREYTQVEISRTDSYFLKMNPPVRDSGDLEDAETITIIGPVGTVTKKAAIIADRHIHINREDREKYNLLNDEYTIKINTEKGGLLEHVKIKELPNSCFELHLDSDDGNAFLLNQGDEVEII